MARALTEFAKSDFAITLRMFVYGQFLVQHKYARGLDWCNSTFLILDKDEAMNEFNVLISTYPHIEFRLIRTGHCTEGQTGDNWLIRSHFPIL